MASLLTALSCSVGVSSSFSTMRRVISSTRARASGGRPDSFGSSRVSSDWRIASNRWRSATTVGTISRDCIHAVNRATSSSTIASARSSSAAAPGEVLVDDRPQVVDVVEEHLVEVPDGRLDVARHGDVDDEERPVAPRPHGLLDARAIPARDPAPRSR